MHIERHPLLLGTVPRGDQRSHAPMAFPFGLWSAPKHFWLAGMGRRVFRSNWRGLEWLDQGAERREEGREGEMVGRRMDLNRAFVTSSGV